MPGRRPVQSQSHLRHLYCFGFGKQLEAADTGGLVRIGDIDDDDADVIFAPAFQSGLVA